MNIGKFLSIYVTREAFYSWYHNNALELVFSYDFSRAFWKLPTNCLNSVVIFKLITQFVVQDLYENMYLNS